MALEIERKYLVKSDAYEREAVRVHRIEQGYLVANEGLAVRIRLRDAEAFLTIKDATDASGVSRHEWEYAIPIEDARQMLAQCGNACIQKERFVIPAGPYCWEVDRFHGTLEGLVLAEIELDDARTEPPLPEWIGREVTGCRAFYNAVLATEGMPPISE